LFFNHTVHDTVKIRKESQHYHPGDIVRNEILKSNYFLAKT